MSVKLLTEQYFKFLSLKGGCTGSSESTLVKMPHCWKSHVAAHILYIKNFSLISKQGRNAAEKGDYFSQVSPSLSSAIVSMEANNINPNL